MREVIGFDADDTLWHTEALFRSTQAEFRSLLSRYHDEDWVEHRLFEAQLRNLDHYGYGIKAFTLTMVETAVELTEGRVSGGEISRILELGREMLHAPIALLDGVPDTLARLADSYELMVITKGDLLDQETKIERSGLRDFFRRVEVVSRKDAATYRRVLGHAAVDADRFLMVGDSLRSDVMPVLEIGAAAVHIPHAIPWRHEVVEIDPSLRARYVELATISALPDALEGDRSLDRATSPPTRETAWRSRT